MARRPPVGRRARLDRVPAGLPGGVGGPKGTEGHGVVHLARDRQQARPGLSGPRRPPPPQLVALARSHRHTYFERLQIEHFNNLERMRPAIRKWRGQWADKPRTADY